MVMGGDSCSRGPGFESGCCILDGHDVFCIGLLHKFVLFVLKDCK